MGKNFKLWMNSLALELASDMAYKLNFFLKVFALFINNLLGPIATVFIYQHSAGIPGWSFPEFILFTGTFTLVNGITHFLFIMMPVRVIEAVRDGSFDKFLVQPFNTILNMTLRGWDLDGLGEILAGLVLVGYGIFTVGLAEFTLLNVVLYIILILFGVLFQYCILLIIASCSFLFVRSYALFELLFGMEKFARYPIDVFNMALRIVLTFIFPVAIASHYPAKTLLRGISGLEFIYIALPVIGFFIISLGFWIWAMKKYRSAGG